MYIISMYYQYVMYSRINQEMISILIFRLQIQSLNLVGQVSLNIPVRNTKGFELRSRPVILAFNSVTKLLNSTVMYMQFSRHIRFLLLTDNMQCSISGAFALRQVIQPTQFPLQEDIVLHNIARVRGRDSISQVSITYCKVLSQFLRIRDWVY